VWLSERVHTVGRDPASSIQIDRHGVSRSHARFFADGGRWVLEDAGSRNGVWVNGNRVKGRAWLEDGDEVRFGRYAFRFGLREPDAPRREGERQVVPASGPGDDSESEVTLDLDLQPFEDESPAPSEDGEFEAFPPLLEDVEDGELGLEGEEPEAGGDTGERVATRRKRPGPAREEGIDAGGSVEADGLLLERLSPHADALAEVLVHRALEGEPIALRLAVERLWPIAAGPGMAGNPEDGLLERAGQLLRSYRKGRLSAPQAEMMLRSLVLDPERE
jgi:pSer/pThr/pTyr-binding forkhead associated (FHA) protein